MVIYRLIRLLVFCVLYFSCSINRNENGQIRIKNSNFENCDSSKDFSIIDTSSLYLSIKINDKTKALVGSNDSVKVADLNNYLKFYGNGKVAMFQGIKKININTINPKNAIMGYYCLNSMNDNKLKFVFYHSQSGIFISNDSFELKGDTIVSFTKKTPRGGGFKTTYIKKKIDENLLIYKPDW